MAAGLVDELQLRVLPIFLASGRRLTNADGGEQRMTLLEAKAFDSGIVALRYAAGPA